MKITQLECWKVDFRLTEPYTIAYETIEKCTNVFLKAETDNGIVAWGCAAPDINITNETGESVLEASHTVIEPCLKGADPFRYLYLYEKMRKNLPKSSSALAMADILLYDIMAKVAGEPLYKFLGGYRNSMPTSVTIGIMPVKETVQKAMELYKRKFSILKIKGGKNVDEDIERIIKVKETLGDNVRLRFDANQGYSVADSVKLVKSTKNTLIELFEQPTLINKEEQLGEVRKNVDIPVMADESLKTLKDVFRLTSNDLIDMINIKLMKVGGITEAININSVASSAGVETMVGCLDESSLGISTGLHFALSRPNINYADLDSFLDIRDDLFKNAIILKDGILYPNGRPGIGI